MASFNDRRRDTDSKPYKLVYGKGVMHIKGIGSQGSYGANAGSDTGRGHVSYSPESACAGLTALGTFHSTSSGHDSLGQALATQKAEYVRKACKTCTKQAERAVAAGVE